MPGENSPPPVRDGVPSIDEKEFAQLRMFAEARDGFHLGIATYDMPATRDAVIARLAEMLTPQVKISVLDLGGSTKDDVVVRQLREHYERAGSDGKIAVMVIGIESALDYTELNLRRSPDQHVKGLEILEAANLHRELFPAACAAPVVFWLTSIATSVFARFAPDLWHWRTGSFCFAMESDAQDDAVWEMLGVPHFEIERSDAQAKKNRIAILRDRLLEEEQSPLSGDPRSRGRQANLLQALGLIYGSQGDLQAAKGFFDRALSIVRENGDRQNESGILGNLGIVHKNSGDLPAAIHYFQEALTICSQIGDRRGEGYALGSLGNAYAQMHEMQKAIQNFERSLTIAREIADRYGEEKSLGNLGAAFGNLKDVPKAIDYYLQSLSISREIGDKAGEAQSLGNLGASYFDLGDTQKAIQFLQQHLTMARDMGNKPGEAAANWNLGECYLSQRDPKRAIDHMQKLVEYEQSIGHPDAKVHADRIAQIKGATMSKNLGIHSTT